MSIPMLSIVVPVYNIESYLQTCIDSILSQQLTDFEVLLIDDGSKDHSGQICDDYAQSDARVRVIHKQNGGSMSARNCGLQNAVGKYVGFVDSDDWIEPDMFSRMVQQAENSCAECVYCGYFVDSDFNKSVKLFDGEGGLYIEEALNELKKSLLGNKTSYEFLLAPSLWSKIYLREKLLPFHFAVPEKIKIGEDAAITVPYVIDCNSLYIIKAPFYHYRIINTSVTHRYNPKQMEENAALFEYLMHTLDEEYKDQLYYYSWRMLVMLLRNTASVSTISELSTFLSEIMDQTIYSDAISFLRNEPNYTSNVLFSHISNKRWSEAAKFLIRERNSQRIKNQIKMIAAKIFKH